MRAVSMERKYASSMDREPRIWPEREAMTMCTGGQFRDSAFWRHVWRMRRTAWWVKWMVVRVILMDEDILWDLVVAIEILFAI